jgi:hypothetical protein
MLRTISRPLPLELKDADGTLVSPAVKHLFDEMPVVVKTRS